MSAQSEGLAIGVETDLPYEDAVVRTKEALKEQGFGVLTEIDVRETLREKIGAEFKKYVIIGACNPPLAHQALSADDDVGLVLPCNVIVFETEGGSAIRALNPLKAMEFFPSSEVHEVGRKAYEGIKAAMDAIASGA
jgi:uncharacterized protein (DUF302 family)